MKAPSLPRAEVRSSAGTQSAMLDLTAAKYAARAPPATKGGQRCKAQGGERQ